MSDDRFEVPDTVAELFEGQDGEAPFDPTTLPGAEVMFTDGDVTVVTVPMSSVSPEDPVKPFKDIPPDVIDAIPPELAMMLGLTLPDPDVDKFVRGQFQQITWAADELEQARQRHGVTDPEADSAFDEALSWVACIDQPYMEPEEFFRAHCREIFERVAKDEDVKPGTDAEILGLLAEMASRIPFCEGLQCLYHRLALKVVPDMYGEYRADYLPEDYTREADEAANHEDADQHYAEFRKELTRERVRAGQGPEQED
jgi:hypothetical protein